MNELTPSELATIEAAMLKHPPFAIEPAAPELSIAVEPPANDFAKEAFDLMTAIAAVDNTITRVRYDRESNLHFVETCSPSRGWEQFGA